MAEEYAQSNLRVSLAQICQSIGFHAITTTSFDVLLDLFHGHLESLCENLRVYADHCGRTEPILDDVGLVFTQMGIPLNELIDYLNQTIPVTFPKPVPKFPVSRPNKLNIPRSDCDELKSRPDHIPYYLPPMIAEKKVEEPIQPIMPENADNVQMPSRVSSRRSTVQQKSEQLNCDDWLTDLYDFDSLKAGLVKLVPIVEPLPPRPPTPLETTYQPPIPKITIVEMSPHQPLFPSAAIAEPLTSKVNQPPLSFSIKTTKTAHPKLQKARTSDEKTPKTVIKEHNISSSSSSCLDKSADISIEECISSVVEQANQFNKVNECISSAIRQMAASVVVQPEVLPQVVESQTLPKPSLKITFSTTSIADAKSARKSQLSSEGKITSRLPDEELPKKLIAEPTVPPVIVQPVAPIPSPFLPHVDVPVVATSNEDEQVNILKQTLKHARQVINKDIIKKRLKKRAEEKEAKRRKLDSVIKKLPPLAVKRPLPPKPVVDTSTLFQPDATILSKVKKVAPLVLPNRKTPVPPQVPAAPVTAAPSGPIAVPTTKSVASQQRPKTPTNKLEPLKIKLSLKPTEEKEDSRKAKKKDKLKDRKVFIDKHRELTAKMHEHREMAAKMYENTVAKGAKKSKMSSLPSNFPNTSQFIDAKVPHNIGKAVAPLPKIPPPEPKILLVDLESKQLEPSAPKIPKLIIKRNPPKLEPEAPREPVRLLETPSIRPIFTISPNPPSRASPADNELSNNGWLNESDTSKHASVVDYRSTTSPPPKSPSMHSKSPSLHSISGTNANSPPPPTPSPRSLSPSSPIGIDIPETETVDFKIIDSSPMTKFISPAISHGSVKMVSPALSHMSSTSSLKSVQPQTAEEKVWFCPVCHVPYEEGADMIACDKCDNWFHWSCVGLTQAPPDDEQWYCTKCAAKKLLKNQKIISTIKKKTRKGSK